MREKLDKVFSIFIRIIYSDFQGFCSCYTCGVRLPWQEMDAGHFIRREFSSVRYDENNVRPQCFDCNRVKGGMEESFEEHLREDLGNEVMNKLIEKGKKEKRFTDEEYQYLIDFYKKEIKIYGIM